MLKAVILLVLTSLASVALAQPSSARNAPQRVEAALIAPAQAADTPAAAPDTYIPPTSPSFSDFLTSSGLANIAKYCSVEAPDKSNQWLHGFICGTRVSDVAIGVYLGLLVVVLVGLVLLGVMQYDMLGRTARQQLRAYLLVETAARAGEHDDNPEFQIVIKNFGQTPAYHVRTWIAVRPGERGSQVGLPGPDPGTLETSDAALGPAGSFELAKRYDRDWDEVGLEDFASGRLALYVYGEVSYRDAFRKRRYTRFRAMYAVEHFRSGGLSIAARGNEST
jgi:hypothetical protein